jgi:hypothetical protein
MHKYGYDGNKDEWTDIFLTDVQGIEISSPPEYPMWYVWLYYFPPCGLFGGHRYKLGHRGIKLYLYAITAGYFALGWLHDFFTLLFCAQNLKVPSELRLVMKDADELDFSIRLKKSDDGQRLRSNIKNELKKHPHMSKSKYVGQFQHIQHPALSDCCKNWFDNTTRDTKIDALSISVHQVHKTKLKKISIPISPCCPVCWLFRPCVCMFCKCCYVSTKDVVDQEIYHKNSSKFRKLIACQTQVSSNYLFGGQH